MLIDFDRVGGSQSPVDCLLAAAPVLEMAGTSHLLQLCSEMQRDPPQYGNHSVLWRFGLGGAGD